MNTPAKLGGYGLLLAAALALGAAVGSAVGPIDVDGGAEEPQHTEMTPVDTGAGT